MADYAYKERESAEAAREMRQGWLRDFAAVPAGGHRSLASFHSRTHGAAAAVGYGKSAMLFVMLRDAIGEDAFRRGIRRFWEPPIPGGDMGRLARRIRASVGDRCRAFFDQWLDRSGGPTVKIAAAGAKSDAGTTRLTLALERSCTPYAPAPAGSDRVPGRTRRAGSTSNGSAMW